MIDIAAQQAEAIEKKADYWRKYLKRLADDLTVGDGYYILKISSLWASTFAYIEWLTVFRLYILHPKFPHIDDIASTLETMWGWDKEIGKLFWAAGRHPIAHVGQANAYYSYVQYKGLSTSVSLDSGQWSEAVTGEWDQYHPNKGVAVLPPLDRGDENVQIIVFFHQMIVDELLPKLAIGVVEQIQEEKELGNLDKIQKLNSQILH